MPLLWRIRLGYFWLVVLSSWTVTFGRTRRSAHTGSNSTTGYSRLPELSLDQTRFLNWTPRHYNATSLQRRRRLGAWNAEAPLPNEKPHPFMLVFTTSVGSSWLMQELSVNPSVCVIGHEPLDDYCDAGSQQKAQNGKRQVGWLRVALTPPSLEVYSEHSNGRERRGEAWRRAWRLWKGKLIQHALPCRVKEVGESIEVQAALSQYLLCSFRGYFCSPLLLDNTLMARVPLVLKQCGNVLR
jgi:hypothetical protein